MGPVCFWWAVHGPSAGNLLQYYLRALLWDYVIALIMIESFRGLLRGMSYIWLVT